MRAPALDLRFSGYPSEHERGLVSAALLDFETAAVHEITDTEWRVFFRSSEERHRAARSLSGTCNATPVDVEDEDWARRSQQDLKAIRVGTLVIAPPWDIPTDEASQGWQLITIEPSTGFGTGHHATTRLCLRMLQQIDVCGKRVLDVGTGSGVLAIAAAKLGAASVIAVDNDPDAIAAARANLERNRVSVELRTVDLERTSLPGADIVLANLTGAMLRRAATTLAGAARGGVLIVSGLLEEERPAISDAFAPFASQIETASEAGWLLLVVTLP